MKDKRSVRQQIKRLGSNLGLSWSVITVVLMIIIFFVSQHFTISHIARAAVQVIPFTLKLESYTFEKTPQGELFHRTTVARRSDGATVLVGTSFGLLGLARGTTARKVILPDGQAFSVVDGVAAFTKWPQRSEARLAAFKEQSFNPPANCVIGNENFVGYGTVLAHKVMVTSHMFGRDKETHWRAPEFLCERLQSRVETQQPDGSFTPASETRPVSLTMGEPDPTLFEIPSYYQSLKPSEVLQKDAARLGIPWDKSLEDDGQNLDKQTLPRP
jgi:hypothetical protein